MMTLHLSPRHRLAAGAAALLALGAAGGAGAVSLTRPDVTMAPTVQTPVAKLASTSGIVSVRGRVAGTFGDRFLVQDATGRALVDAGRGNADAPALGSTVTVQGRFADGQLHARYLVDGDGTVREVAPPPPPHGPGRPGGPGAPGMVPPPPHGPGMAPPPPPPPPADGVASAVSPPPPPAGAVGAPPAPPASPPANAAAPVPQAR